MSAFKSCRRAVWSVMTVTAVTLAMVAVPGSAQAAPSDGISGTVRTSAGQPVQGIEVTACTAAQICGAPASTGVNGTYSVIGLAPGDYYVTFIDRRASYLTQRHPNIIATTTAGPGTPVRVTLDQVTTGIDNVAVPGSTFSGTVTGPAGPLADICVAPATGDGYTTGDGRCTDSGGRYTTAGLPSGTYHLVFVDNQSRHFVPQWYDNQPDTLGHPTATPLTTQPGDQPLRNVVMQLGGHLTGVATANGAPLANVYVTLFPAGSNGPGLHGGQADGAGRFTTLPVPPGSYRIGYIDYDGATLPANTYVYYNNAQTLATAAAVTVTQGQTTVLGAPIVPGAPGAPTGVSATAGDRAATVTFRAPASNGGSPITRYTLTPSPACSSCTGLTSTTTSSTVRGLTNGTAYTFRVTATSAGGTSPVSASSTSVTPRAAVVVTPRPAVAAITRLSDFNRDGVTDMVARDSYGRLWLYPGNGSGGFLPKRQIGAGWNVMTAILTTGDVTGDRNADILARDTAGRMWLYPSTGTGGFLPRRQIGLGWNSMTSITGAANLNGTGRPDVLARDTAGNLWLYPLVGNGVFGARTRVGTGWNGYTITGPGDVSGDTRADILARDRAGSLWLYPGTGTGRVNSRIRVSPSWSAMTALVTPGNWDRAAGNDLLARDAQGRLWLYPGSNASSLLSRRQVGAGWQVMTYIG